MKPSSSLRIQSRIGRAAIGLPGIFLPDESKDGVRNDAYEWWDGYYDEELAHGFMLLM